MDATDPNDPYDVADELRFRLKEAINWLPWEKSHAIHYALSQAGISLDDGEGDDARTKQAKLKKLRARLAALKAEQDAITAQLDSDDELADIEDVDPAAFPSEGEGKSGEPDWMVQRRDHTRHPMPVAASEVGQMVRGQREISKLLKAGANVSGVSLVDRARQIAADRQLDWHRLADREKAFQLAVKGR